MSLSAVQGAVFIMEVAWSFTSGPAGLESSGPSK